MPLPTTGGGGWITESGGFGSGGGGGAGSSGGAPGGSCGVPSPPPTTQSHAPRDRARRTATIRSVPIPDHPTSASHEREGLPPPACQKRSFPCIFRTTRGHAAASAPLRSDGARRRVTGSASRGACAKVESQSGIAPGVGDCTLRPRPACECRQRRNEVLDCRDPGGRLAQRGRAVSDCMPEPKKPPFHIIHDDALRVGHRNVRARSRLPSVSAGSFLGVSSSSTGSDGSFCAVIECGWPSTARFASVLPTATSRRGCRGSQPAKTSLPV